MVEHEFCPYLSGLQIAWALTEPHLSGTKNSTIFQVFRQAKKAKNMADQGVDRWGWPDEVIPPMRLCPSGFYDENSTNLSTVNPCF